MSDQPAVYAYVDELRRLARRMRREGVGGWAEIIDRLATEMREGVRAGVAHGDIALALDEALAEHEREPATDIWMSFWDRLTEGGLIPPRGERTRVSPVPYPGGER